MPTNVETGLKLMEANIALVDGALVTVMIMVFVVTPSWPVITVVMVLAPTAKGMLAEAVPETTALPFTIIGAVTSFAVGITCTEVWLFGTAAVKFRYPAPVVLNKVVTGLRLTEASSALVDGALFTVIIIVLAVTPSWAVITVVMVLAPTDNGILAEAVPELTALPFTIMLAVASFAVGIT